MKIGNIEVYGVIYRIENTINKKSYIGKTKLGFDKRYPHKGDSPIEKVYTNHIKNKTNNISYNRHLLFSIQKYGKESFNVYKIIDIAFSEKELNIKEKSWISIYDSFNNGYNNTLGGDGSSGSFRPKGSNAYRTTKIICLNDLKVFDCVIDASIYYDVSKTSISSNCSNNINKNSVEQKSRNKLFFMYYEDYLISTNKDITEKLNYKYIPKSGKDVYNARKIICLSTNEVFESISDAVEKYSILQSNITRCCKRKYGYCGIKNGIRLKWMYYDEYIEGEKYGKLSNEKTIECITTGEIFESAKQAEIKYDVDRSSIASCCRGKLKSAGRLSDGTRLQWRYIEDNH